MKDWTKGKLTVQELEVKKNGYENWNTYAVRSQNNICLAVVGEVDRYFEKDYKAVATMFAGSPAVLNACKSLMKQAVYMAEDLGKDASDPIWAIISDASDAISNSKEVEK